MQYSVVAVKTGIYWSSSFGAIKSNLECRGGEQHIHIYKYATETYFHLLRIPWKGNLRPGMDCACQKILEILLLTVLGEGEAPPECNTADECYE
mmetsp:Transcript_26140/g.77369  ORF Transcript_26140/g.77369 Transcript_26140/m.77369 type:complete len:94 (+) Transcript_26140:1367-1648(+)